MEFQKDLPLPNRRSWLKFLHEDNASLQGFRSAYNQPAICSRELLKRARLKRTKEVSSSDKPKEGVLVDDRPSSYASRFRANIDRSKESSNILEESTVRQHRQAHKPVCQESCGQGRSYMSSAQEPSATTTTDSERNHGSKSKWAAFEKCPPDVICFEDIPWPNISRLHKAPRNKVWNR